MRSLPQAERTSAGDCEKRGAVGKDFAAFGSIIPRSPARSPVPMEIGGRNRSLLRGRARFHPRGDDRSLFVRHLCQVSDRHNSANDYALINSLRILRNARSVIQQNAGRRLAVTRKTRRGRVASHTALSQNRAHAIKIDHSLDRREWLNSRVGPPPHRAGPKEWERGGEGKRGE